MDEGLGRFITVLFAGGLTLLMLASFWRVFAKAGQTGWAAIVPIYSMVVMLRIAGKPLWWLLLWFIPLVGVVICCVISVAIARNFGKGIGFGLGLVFLGFIFYPILGFGGARYKALAATAMRI